MHLFDTKLFATAARLGTVLSLCLVRAVSGPGFANPLTPAEQPLINTPAEIMQADVLKSGDTLDRELAGGQSHSYRIEVAANQFLHIVVEQHGIDVVLSLSDPHGVELSKVDRPNGSRGRETISMIAPANGYYNLNIRTLESVTAQGRYQLLVTPLRPAKAQDQIWITAEQTVTAAEDLRAEGSAESVGQAIEKFNHTADLWRSLDEPYEEAIALYGSGVSCTALGENQRGIEYFNRALQ